MYKVLFSTPVFTFNINDLKMNSELSQLLLEMRANGKTLKRSGHKNWHSDWLQDKNDPCLKKLFGLINNHFGDVLLNCGVNGYECQWSVSSWGVINEKNDYHALHSHPHSDWSAVYYVCKDDKDSGDLLLLDPRGSLVESARTKIGHDEFYAKMFGTNSSILSPTTGLLVFFPSWLMHTVLPHKEDKQRISISVNYSLKDCKSI